MRRKTDGSAPLALALDRGALAAGAAGKMRLIIYTRVSTEDQAEKYGLDAQLRACRTWAREHVIVSECSDDISGATLHRPGLTLAREMVRCGDADAILALCSDRISRDLSDLLLVDREVRLLFVQEQYDDSPVGRLFLSIRGAFGEYERKLIAERSKRGKIEKARRGLWVCGRVAYGYRVDNDEHLEVNEVEAGIIRRIFAWYDGGASIRGIVQMLRGERAWNGGAWSRASVRQVLRNETYAGVARYNAWKRAGKWCKPRAAEEHILFPVPPIVEREQFDRVQARLAENPFTGRPSGRYMMRGLLWCSCGLKMHGCSGEYYVCSRGDRRARAHLLDAAVWHTVSASLRDEKTLLRLISARRDTILEAPDTGSMKERVLVLRRRESQLASAMLDADLADHREAARAKLRAVRAERLEIERRIEAAKPCLLPTRAMAKEICSTVQQLGPEHRQEFVRRCVESATFDGRKVRLDMFFEAKEATTSACFARFRWSVEGIIPEVRCA